MDKQTWKSFFFVSSQTIMIAEFVSFYLYGSSITFAYVFGIEYARSDGRDRNRLGLIFLLGYATYGAIVWPLFWAATLYDRLGINL